MPMTPLHLGLLAPINHWFPNKVNNLSFILVNLLLDTSAIAYFGFGLDLGELHGPMTHSLLGALVIALLVSAVKIGSAAWILGAFLGWITHILLDAMVHSEMLPFYPVPGNPLYWGGMDWITGILIPPTVWLIAQYVSTGLCWLKKQKGQA